MSAAKRDFSSLQHTRTGYGAHLSYQMDTKDFSQGTGVGEWS